MHRGATHTSFVQTYAPAADVQTLVSYGSPVGPHLAAQQEGRVVSDEDLLGRIADALATFDARASDAVTTSTFIETAGGVNSPSSSGTAAGGGQPDQRLGRV